MEQKITKSQLIELLNQISNETEIYASISRPAEFVGAGPNAVSLYVPGPTSFINLRLEHHGAYAMRNNLLAIA